MIDGRGRTIDYLRISVTDRCNLRCRYCMPAEGIRLIPHDGLLTLEEIYRVVCIMSQLGIKKVRFTGGEPLVRKNLAGLIEKVGRIPQIDEMSMTTNGILFKDNAKRLKEAGLNSVNISLDTLDGVCFKNITGYDGIDKVYEAVDEALRLGLKTKINCVPCRELNGDGYLEIAKIAKDKPVDVRFIELMPVGCGREFTGIGAEEILKSLEKIYGMAERCYEKRGNGPAVYYGFKGFCGKIGFISPISHKFCSECNRVRLTAEGRLKLCLHYDNGIELKPLLRSGLMDEEIKKLIVEQINNKPSEHNFENKDAAHSDSRKMVQIGG